MTVACILWQGLIQSRSDSEDITSYKEKNIIRKQRIQEVIELHSNCFKLQKAVFYDLKQTLIQKEFKEYIMNTFNLKKISGLIQKGIALTVLVSAICTPSYAYDRTEVKIGVVGENN